MIFTELPLKGAFLIEPERLEDNRGFFARTFCADEFTAHGLVKIFVQCNISYNRRRGSLRGLHYQAPPHEEARLVRCTAGSAFDVIVDIRPGSPTLAQWFGVQLSAENRKMVYIPEGFAHGFQTLADHTELFYQMSAPHVRSAARGIRWDDRAIGIRWPITPVALSERDQSYPEFAA
jgi:dTDP-4-dehydrorhamnose 3,5-epimerase